MNLYETFGIPMKIALTQSGLQLPRNTLPHERITGEIVVPGETQPRCKIVYKSVQYHGAHGQIQLIQRTPHPTGATQRLCCKRPFDREFSLVPEALVQKLASDTLKKGGVDGAVASVWDIYTCANETRFTMDFIEGVSLMQWLQATERTESDFYTALAQISLLLGYLEEQIHLDHRDLKAENLWVRMEPVSYKLPIRGTTWSHQAPFQIVLLDFGFVCLGDTTLRKGGGVRMATVNLSDGALPTIDPCPKEGRDLFQLLIHMWAFPWFRQRASVTMRSRIEGLLSYRGTTYGALAATSGRSDWSYLAVSDPHFSYPILEPTALLEKLCEWGLGASGLLTRLE